MLRKLAIKYKIMKTYLNYLLIVFFTLLISCSKKENLADNNDDNNIVTREWTYLFYCAADFDNAYNPFNNFAELVSSNDDINYIVFFDGEERRFSEVPATGYYKVTENNRYVLLENLGEINMGSGDVLEDFINYGKQNFPAEKYILAFYGHGAGWAGACSDKDPVDDLLTCGEMSEAIRAAGNVNLILYTAPCLMGSVEATYQMKGCADYYIGSENTSGFLFWLFMLNEMDNYLKTNSSLSVEDLARQIILQFSIAIHQAPEYYTEYTDYFTMSAIDLSKSEELVVAFNEVAEYYKDHQAKFKQLVNPDDLSFFGSYCNLHKLLKTLEENETDQAAKDLISETILCFNNCVVTEFHGDSCADFRGLNIWFPNSEYIDNYGIYYDPYGIGLDFKNDCSWEELLMGVTTKSSETYKPLSPMGSFTGDGYIPHSIEDK